MSFLRLNPTDQDYTEARAWIDAGNEEFATAMEARDLATDRWNDETLAVNQLYGEHLKSGTVIPLGRNRPPRDTNERAA